MATTGSVHHTGLTVSDLGRSITFYTEILGCTVILEQEKTGGYLADIVGYPDARVKMAMLHDPAGHHIIELFQYLSPEMLVAELEPRKIGNAHLCFLVDDLDSFYARIQNKGVTFISGPVRVDTGANAGGAALYMKDPDGITIELFQPAVA